MAKKQNTSAARERKQKIIIGVGVAVFAVLMVLQGPKLLKAFGGGSDSTAATAAASTPEAATPSGAPAATGAPATPTFAVRAPKNARAQLAGVVIVPEQPVKAGDGQLGSFSRFDSKDPFVQQVHEAPLLTPAQVGGFASRAKQTAAAVKQRGAAATSAGAAAVGNSPGRLCRRADDRPAERQRQGAHRRACEAIPAVRPRVPPEVAEARPGDDRGRRRLVRRRRDARPPRRSRSDAREHRHRSPLRRQAALRRRRARRSRASRPSEQTARAGGRRIRADRARDRNRDPERRHPRPLRNLQRRLARPPAGEPDLHRRDGRRRAMELFRARLYWDLGLESSLVTAAASGTPRTPATPPG